jgi:hypothetical protein
MRVAEKLDWKGLIQETKKALYTRLLRRYSAASKQSVCEYALEESACTRMCALGSTEWPNCNKERLLLRHQVPYHQLSSPSLPKFSEKKDA